MNAYEKIVKLADKDSKLITRVTACLEPDLLQVYTIKGLFLDGYAQITYIMRGRI